jgi:hypothetical protein
MIGETADDLRGCLDGVILLVSFSGAFSNGGAARGPPRHRAA